MVPRPRDQALRQSHERAGDDHEQHRPARVRPPACGRAERRASRARSVVATTGGVSSAHGHQLASSMTRSWRNGRRHARPRRQRAHGRVLKGEDDRGHGPEAEREQEEPAQADQVRQPGLSGTGADAAPPPGWSGVVGSRERGSMVRNRRRPSAPIGHPDVRDLSAFGSAYGAGAGRLLPRSATYLHAPVSCFCHTVRYLE